MKIDYSHGSIEPKIIVSLTTDFFAAFYVYPALQAPDVGDRIYGPRRVGQEQPVYRVVRRTWDFDEQTRQNLCHLFVEPG